MPIDKRAETQWNRAQHAYDHYIDYIKEKNDKYALSFTDLVYVKNFKGGSATIAEPVTKTANKLQKYQDMLQRCAANPAFGMALGTISCSDYPAAKRLMIDFAKLPEASDADISGFGCSFASALLHFYFPAVVPILDKRALNGAKIDGIKVDQQNNVRNLLALYPNLIDVFRAQLCKNSKLSLRELDRRFFIERLRPPFRVTPSEAT